MNPFLGVFYHWLGGFASGSFYVPYRFVRKWSWEVYWLVGGVFSWIFAPWIAAFLLTENLLPVLYEGLTVHRSDMGLAFLFGMMWGMGGLTFGLTMRYLGMSLGMAVALGYCTVFGTVMPPIFKGTFASEVLGTTSGVVILLGVGVCVLGIVTAAFAGMSKEREMPEEAKREAIKEFSFVKGLIVATFSGIMSAGMSYGMAAAAPLSIISAAHGTEKIWTELPRLCIILAGGFTSNFIWCLFLFVKNKTGKQFYTLHVDDIPAGGPENEGVTDAPSEEVAKQARSLDVAKRKFPPSVRVPIAANYIFCAMAGTCWYLQFFFYSMGETQMGAYQFASWPLHMASIMIFSSIWGLALLEWKGSSLFTKSILGLGLTTLIFSTVVIGYGAHVGKTTKENEIRRIAEVVRFQSIGVSSFSDGDNKRTLLVENIYANIEELYGLAMEIGLSEKISVELLRIRQIIDHKEFTAAAGESQVDLSETIDSMLEKMK